ncbi:MAG TPA: DUF305 domain-containing protein [Xanthobacteraceae bacterium]|nr:DUF305 domain-containing protein [Xanthobacteraceae bacterium]
MQKSMYLNLGAMILLMFIAMFVLMYSMVDKFADIYPNINQVYMAGLMTAPMIVIELVLMWRMYPNAKANAAIVIASVILGILFFAAIRYQTVVGNTQFLKSMIPHHSGAILMCGNAPVTDQRIKDLCKTIIAGQQSEIDQMKAILRNPR